ncbi:MAG: bifunctional phosphopantothenoylcysteine decarboxylase/phosphopantothenate synthase [Methanobacterium sp. PtaU1.Bin242]|nr:MAG: bifunctional phosphopantothenoylcysteine decarboxylase/phosphopantothenate synthase [Methanobacterium sp. PtaU1.Bin242]
MNKQDKRKKIAWGITGSGEKIAETVAIMQKMKDKYQDQFDIRVFISKAGDTVLKYYNLSNILETTFDKTWTEINANAPFLAGQIQLKKFDFLLIAPTTSNTVAKISLRIADTLLTNAAIMGQKTSTPIYIMPTDFKEGIVTTRLPNGKDLDIKITKQDADHVRNLEKMANTYVFENPDEIPQIFEKHSNL